MYDNPAKIETPKSEIKLSWDAANQVVQVDFAREQFRTYDMVLMVLEAARLSMQTARETAIAQARMQQMMQAQQEAQLRQRLLGN